MIFTMTELRGRREEVSRGTDKVSEVRPVRSFHLLPDYHAPKLRRFREARTDRELPAKFSGLPMER
jgi:hypothetical protein